MNEPTPEPPATVPLWRNPFVIAFVIGAFFLTVLPFMQRRFLKAPPPGPSLGSWRLELADGGTLGAEQLKGKVWIGSFAADPVGRAEFSTILRHVEDLGDKIALVSFIAPGERGPAGSDRWFVVTGSPTAFEALAMKQFQPAYAEFARVDAGSTLAEWTSIRTMAVVDQNGALRGFWRDDDLGRGNAINAARLLARHGPTP